MRLHFLSVFFFFKAPKVVPKYGLKPLSRGAQKEIMGHFRMQGKFKHASKKYYVSQLLPQEEINLSQNTFLFAKVEKNVFSFYIQANEIGPNANLFPTPKHWHPREEAPRLIERSTLFFLSSLHTNLLFFSFFPYVCTSLQPANAAYQALSPRTKKSALLQTGICQ